MGILGCLARDGMQAQLRQTPHESSSHLDVRHDRHWLRANIHAKHLGAGASQPLSQQLQQRTLGPEASHCLQQPVASPQHHSGRSLPMQGPQLCYHGLCHIKPCLPMQSMLQSQQGPGRLLLGGPETHLDNV